MNQSGIRVSETLAKTFASLDNNVRALKVSIIDESLVANGTLSVSGDFQHDFNNIADLVDLHEAAYILVLQDNGQYLFVSYVGESAKVKDKMMYASTRNTVSRELGSAKFSTSYFATTKDELTFSAYAKQELGTSAEAPLSEKEKDLKSVKEAEEEVNNTQTKRAIASTGMSFPVSEPAQEALNVLKTTSTSRVVSLSINMKTETIELESDKDIEIDALDSAVPKDAPRYTFYAWVHEVHGNGVTTQCFIYTCPGSSKVRERMLYSSNRQGIISSSGIAIDHKYEAEDLDLSDLKNRLDPPKETKSSTFSRPKRPGKK
ncbi:Putative uncharacterized protein [Taphrina deformans PYCC 5710]|uniref:ADF-H domain-containing protein n=1 Tax=Taphrina deformans (strain PYCC 5710 / ATCC 11124 / CBS 356.35 / IMI 108563 / JCM 9778 / NBRC 8474) TaxID=1097556 RepID=R4XAQ3_TAPDE|nr:Putative uncharacterized protein [Taphrina deformans PYCC 5710]|eukprot:CCG81398.1 Putative uncharacterized protein [Taphrina deformans PYCC 5710]